MVSLNVSLNHGGIEMETTQIAVFSAGEYVCGIETAKVNTIIRYQQPETVEGAPEFIEGLIKWKDSTIPVVDLRVMFGEGETPVTKKTKILIVNTGGQLAGFIVDDINIIRKYSEDEIEAAPPVLTQYETGYLKAVCKSESGLVPVLDFEKILTESEISQFAANTR
jgi:purine-binding chemotaxis protein CheW